MSNEATIKEIAAALGVSKPTISRAAHALGIEPQKLGNRHTLTEEQQEQITAYITQKTQQSNATIETNATDETPQTRQETETNETKTEQSQQKPQQTEQSQQGTETALIEILREQLATKDKQIEALNAALTAAYSSLQETTAALNAAQALHAGTIRQQLKTTQAEQDSDQNHAEQPQKRGIFALFSRRKPKQ